MKEQMQSAHVQGIFITAVGETHWHLAHPRQPAHLGSSAAVLRDAVLGAAVLGLRVRGAVGAVCRGALHIDDVRVLKALLCIIGRSVSSLQQGW